MQGENRERCLVLCEQAAIEQDPDKLMALIREITALLESKEQRLHRVVAERKPDAHVS
jgi:hypothetical protein